MTIPKNPYDANLKSRREIKKGTGKANVSLKESVMQWKEAQGVGVPCTLRREGPWTAGGLGIEALSVGDLALDPQPGIQAGRDRRGCLPSLCSPQWGVSTGLQGQVDEP